MEFTFLGTSAGTPTRSRNVTGLALCHSGPKPWYLVLTHFSSRHLSGPGGTPHINQLAAEAPQHYQGQLFLARDFDTYRLAKDLSLSCLTTETTAP